MAAVEEMKTLINQIAFEIAMQMERLDEIRRKSFQTWLNAHQRIVLTNLQKPIADMALTDSPSDLNSFSIADLATWLGLLPTQTLLMEYRLILEEISWWHDLEANLLTDGVLRNNRKAGE